MSDSPSHDPADRHGPGEDFCIADWVIQPSLNRATRFDTTIHLRPQLIDLLVCLAGSPGRTLSRTELLDRVWPGQYVADTALARCVAEIRQALGDAAQTPTIIETIPKRGYRLIAPVRPVCHEPAVLGDGTWESPLPAVSGVELARLAPVLVRAQEDLPSGSRRPSRPPARRRLIWAGVIVVLSAATATLVWPRWTPAASPTTPAPTSLAGSPSVLAAIRAGDQAIFRGAYEEALPHYRRATTLDPQCALAWAKLGVVLFDLRRRGEAHGPLSRAFALRHEVSQPEQLYIAGHYYHGVQENAFLAIDAFAGLSRTSSHPLAARVNLSTLYQQVGLWEYAVTSATEAVRFAPGSSIARVVLAGAVAGTGRFDAALQTITEMEELGLASPSSHDLRHDVGFLLNRQDIVDHENTFAERHGAMRPFLLVRRARIALYRGRLSDARREWEAVRQDAASRQDDITAASALVSLALAESLIGDRVQMEQAIVRALTIDRGPSQLAQAALARALAGNPDGARQLLREYDALVVRGSDRDLEFVAPARAALAASEGRVDDVEALLAPIQPYQLGTRFEYLPLYIRGQAALARHEFETARLAFETITTHQGIAPFSVVHALAWLGRARACAGLGQAREAAHSYDTLFRLWRDADVGLSELRAARREVGQVADAG